MECAIPHYHAVKATEALKAKYPDLYLYDPTPIATALWRVASKCVAVEPRGEGKDKVWTFTDKREPRRPRRDESIGVDRSVRYSA